LFFLKTTVYYQHRPCFCGDVILDRIALVIGMVSSPHEPTTAAIVKTYTQTILLKVYLNSLVYTNIHSIVKQVFLLL